MKNRHKISALTKATFMWFFMLLGGVVYAQDFHLSQYEASPMYFNPAMTGLFEGDQRLSLHYRNQWRTISTRAFTTTALSFDTHFKKVKNLNIGLFILNNRAGAGNYNNMNLVLSGSYDYKFKNPKHHVCLGVQGGMIHKSVNISKLVFDEQIALSDGGAIGDPSLNNGELFSNQGIFNPALNAGLIYFYADDASLFNPFIGVSSFNLTEPNESFYGATNKLPRRYLVHLGTKVNLSPKFQVSANVMGMAQTNAREITTSLFGYYYLRDSGSYVMYGNTYRSKDALMVHLGLKYKDFTYRFSYDINTSSLSTVTRGKGAFELSIVYIVKKVNPNPIKSCPRL